MRGVDWIRVVALIAFFAGLFFSDQGWGVAMVIAGALVFVIGYYLAK